MVKVKKTDSIIDVICKATGESRAQARRLVKQGAIKIGSIK